MILNILESLLVGVSIAAIPGPIFFELIRRTLAKGLHDGIFLVLGEFSGNFLLLLAIFFGLSQFLTNGTAETVFFIVSGLILIWVSNGAIRLEQSDVESNYDMKSPQSKGKSYVTGLTIAVTSPIVIALWVSLSNSYLKSIDNHFLAGVNILFIALGFLVFFIPLAYFVYRTRHRIPPDKVVMLSKVFGTVLIAYALILFYQAVA